MSTKKKHSPTFISSAFEEEFDLEILKSDRLRITTLIAVITSSVLFLIVLLAFAFEQFQLAFHGKIRGFLFSVAVVSGSALTCLIVEWLIVRRIISRQERAPIFLQYFSALLETSIPTAGMIVGSFFLGPVYTLFTPAAFIYPIFIVLSGLRLNLKLCIFTGAVAGLEYLVLALYFVRQARSVAIEPILIGVPHHVFKAFLLLAIGVVTGVVTLQVRKRILKSFEIVAERNRISRTFGEYVSPVVMDTLLTMKPDLRSERRSVCVMFLDIRNFTMFAEKRTPEEVVAYLESLFEFMIEIINRHNGVINKFLGDGFMAVFGAPLSDGSDCQNAVGAAQEILVRIDQEVAQGRVLPTSVGIGLHSGEAVTGSIGSSLRREYTVIGDVVNLAARIEKLNKKFGSHLLISDDVWKTVSDFAPAAIPMGDVHVQGREGAIQIYRVA